METVGTDICVHGETPQLAEDATVASDAGTEGPAIDEALDASVEEPVLKSSGIIGAIGDAASQEDSEAQPPHPPVLELSEETLNSETPDSNDSINSQGEGKGKEKEPRYPEHIQTAPESPAGPSNSSPPSILPNPRANYSLPAYGSQIPWEVDAERPAQKLPILFKDAVGRKFLIPWRRAKTWEGMKMTIDSAFEKIDGPLGVHVPAGHYDLSFTAASCADENTNHGENPAPTGPSSSSPETLSRSNVPVIIMPDFWEDLIQPGMSVNMTMWPIGVCIPMNSRSQWPGGNPPGRAPGAMPGFGVPTTVPPPPQHFGIPNIVDVGPLPVRRRGKTRVNPGRPVRK
ncbi:Fc.00g099590.m01.CDS01 [Cosmosporella sp. VM-42]